MVIKLILSSPLFQRIVEPYKNNLKKIGLKLDIKVVQIAKYEEILRNFDYDMIVANYPQSRSPGNEQRSMWSSEAESTAGSRNYMGIKNPAIDELIDRIVEAKSRKELINSIQAMDRILTHQFYIVPNWYIPYDRIVYWNKFSRPNTNPSQSLIINNISNSYEKIFAKSLQFICNNCGYKSHILNWLCPSCNSWECIAPRSAIDIIEDGKTNESN